MARGKKKAEAAETPPPAVRAPWLELSLLLVAPFASALLSLFQWMELIVSQLGGEISCAIGDRLDCAAVWASPGAKAIQRISGMPVAGWGLIWSVSAFGVGIWLVRTALFGGPLAAGIFAARLFAAAGVVVSVGLLGVTLNLGTFCVTCLATYALVAAQAGAAFRMKPERPLASVGVVPVAAPVSALLVASYLLLYIPGSRTPIDPPVDLGIKKSSAVATPPPPKGPVPPQASRPLVPDHAEIPADDPVAAFIADLNPSGRQAVANGIAAHKASRVVDTTRYTSRRVIGPATARVSLVDFSDIRCSHCKHLAETMEQLEAQAGKSFRHESRWFPLDGACNPKVPPDMIDASGVRCLGAKAMICLEGNAAYDPIRRAVFAEQQSITVDRILLIAEEKGRVKKSELMACIQSKVTAEKLNEDIDYAAAYGIEGTPLVLVNGREGSPMGPFLYAMILAQGDSSAPGFGLLPPGKAHDHEHDH